FRRPLLPAARSALLFVFGVGGVVLGAGLDPFADLGDLVGLRLRLVRRRHGLALARKRQQQAALVGLFGDDNGPFLALLHQALDRLDAVTRLGLAVVVAVQAVFRQERLDVLGVAWLRVGRRRKGRRPQKRRDGHRPDPHLSHSNLLRRGIGEVTG